MRSKWRTMRSVSCRVRWGSRRSWSRALWKIVSRMWLWLGSWSRCRIRDFCRRVRRRVMRLMAWGRGVRSWERRSEGFRGRLAHTRISPLSRLSRFSSCKNWLWGKRNVLYSWSKRYRVSVRKMRGWSRRAQLTSNLALKKTPRLPNSNPSTNNNSTTPFKNSYNFKPPVNRKSKPSNLKFSIKRKSLSSNPNS